MRSLRTYLDKRDFAATPEPSEGGEGPGLAPRYSMQKHDATRLHFDLRLEHDGVLLSWAVTRGPSYAPADKRLAVRTEDHPVSYLDFEGVIPPGSYGAGTVMLWDIGHWQPFHDVGDGLDKGHLHFALHGRRNTGRWNLIRMKGRKSGDARRENWLLIKEDDEAAHRPDPVESYLTSIRSGRHMGQIADGAPEAPMVPERRAARSRFRKPQLATLSDTGALDGDAWHELKIDGYRALIAIGRGGARVFTRSGKDWSDRFAPLLPPLEALPAETALLDGEITAGAGLHGFGALQRAIKAGGPFTFYAFDLLQLDSTDLAPLPLRDRRARLEKLLANVPPRGVVQLSPVLEGDPRDGFDAVCEAGGEGLILKQADAPYRGGRSTAWLKVKCERRAEFVIAGYQPSDKRGRAFASLLLATQEPEAGLVYRGKVGTGFDGETQDDLATRMAALTRETAPLAEVPPEARGAVWLRPSLVAEIRFAEVTGDGRLRHASFVALRDDKPAPEVRMERDMSGRTDVAGIGISSGDRVIFPKPRITKLDLARYHAEMADRILTEAADRPVSLLRLPEGLEGEQFFQKHAGKGFPDAVGRITIDGTEWMTVTDAAGLVGAVQMGTVEFHIWGARRDRLDRPDRMVFDLDPDEGLKFAQVRSAAADLRDVLADLGLPSYAMVTGGKGVHVVVPLRRIAGWDTVKLFARTLAHVLAQRDPDRFIATMAKARRKDRIFIDWLRNERGATAIAPFSVRARACAPVAIPVAWDELASLRGGDAFSMDKARERRWSDLAVPDATGLSAKVIDRLERFAAETG